MLHRTSLALALALSSGALVWSAPIPNNAQAALLKRSPGFECLGDCMGKVTSAIKGPKAYYDKLADIESRKARNFVTPPAEAAQRDIKAALLSHKAYLLSDSSWSSHVRNPSRFDPLTTEFDRAIEQHAVNAQRQQALAKSSEGEADSFQIWGDGYIHNTSHSHSLWLSHYHHHVVEGLKELQKAARVPAATNPERQTAGIWVYRHYQIVPKPGKRRVAAVHS